MVEMRFNHVITVFLVMLVFFTIFHPINVKTRGSDVGYLNEVLKHDSIMFAPTLKPLVNDLILPDDYERSRTTYRTTSAQEGPDADQTSLFMIGKISVSIIFMESNGTVDTETEEWDQWRVDQVTNEIETALNWHAAQEPDARIQWVIHSQVIETSYEPINRPSVGIPSQGIEGEEYLWVNEAMEYLGYDMGGRKDSARIKPYADDLRNEDDTHWAFAIFVVDSLNDPDGAFPDGYIAYAHGFGPYFVTTYDVDGYRDQGKFEEVMAHETAHIFGAADEYPPCWCNHTYGFLEVLNLNCTSGCPEGSCAGGEPDCQGCNACYESGCLMETLDQCLSVSTKYQLGWRDENNNGILDAVDSTYNNWLDTDGDKVVDYLDNCPYVYNPDQTDTDGDWIGDVCESGDIVPPKITIISPESKTYYGSSIPLTFTINEETSWIGYSLDNQPNVTITGDTTLSGLSYDYHNVIVYATDTSGNTGASDRVYFRVSRSSGGGGGRNRFLMR